MTGLVRGPLNPRRAIALALAVLVGVCGCTPAPTGAGGGAGRVIVGFAAGTTEVRARQVLAAARLLPVAEAGDGLWLVDAPDGTWRQLAGHPSEVLFAESDAPRARQMVGAFRAPGPGGGTPGLGFRTSAVAVTPPDPTLPGLPGQWHLDARGVNAQAAWAAGRQGAGVVVAVVDTGVDATHPDLAGQLLPGRNFVEAGSAPDDDFGHGTHLAGLIAAVPNPVTTASGRPASVSGVAPGARVLPVRVLGTDQGDVFTEIQGIQYAVAQGARVINLSLGSGRSSQAEEAAVRAAVSAGVVVVAAAGNDALDGNPAFYPASYPGVISVAAVDLNRQRAPFSEFNPRITVAAPGMDLLSTVPVKFGTFAYASGTSMAAPVVSGLAALLLAAHPSWTPAQVATQLTGAIQPLTGSPELGAVGEPDASRFP